jgi:hypothetical protein
MTLFISFLAFSGFIAWAVMILIVVLIHMESK